jgi:hypothetical protein
LEGIGGTGTFSVSGALSPAAVQPVNRATSNKSNMDKRNKRIKTPLQSIFSQFAPIFEKICGWKKCIFLMTDFALVALLLPF